MKRKNLVAMGLAGIMAVGMCMPVMAAEGDPTKVGPTSSTVGTPNPSSVETTVDYTEPISYEVTIPTKITYTGTVENDTITLSVDQDKFLIGSTSKVSITINDIDNFALKQGDTLSMPMQLKKGNEVVTAATSAEFTNASKDNVVYTIERINTDKLGASGEYTGKITFNIAYN